MRIFEALSGSIKRGKGAIGEIRSTRKLNFDILTSFIFILIVSFGSIVLFYRVKIHAGFLQLATSFTQDVSAKNIDQVKNLLNEMKSNVELLASFILKRSDISVNNLELDRFISRVILNSPAITTVSCISDEGNLIQGYRCYPNQMYLSDNKKPIPEGSVFGYRNIQVTPSPFESWSYRNKDGVEIGREKVDQIPYNPLTRDYFAPLKKVMDFAWTDMYYSKSSKLLTFAAIQPLFDDQEKYFGIAHSSMRLEALTQFLEENQFSSKGLQFIFNEKQEIIAGTGIDVQKIIEELGRPITLKDLNNVKINKVYDVYQKEKKNHFILEIEGVDWLVTVTALSQNGLEWNLLLMAPTSEYLSAFIKTQRDVFLVGLSVMLVAFVCGIFLSKKISSPVEKMNEEIEKIKQFDFEDEIDIPTEIKELQTVADALKSLKSSLREFGYYVPKQIVNRLLETGEDVHVGGKNESVTIFFSDIYNFMEIVETMDPNELMPHLSEYLNAMSQEIVQNKGTIDKYTGDNIMAFWGAPVPLPGHASFACRTALLCQQRSNELNREGQKSGKPPFLTMIGIHSGEAVVGNVGTSDRINYTAIGETVNLAARLEKLNKFYRTKILISETTRLEIGDNFISRPIDTVSLKGKEAGTKLYELLAVAGSPEAAMQENFGQKFADAYQMYIEKKFDTALKAFEAFEKEFPNDYPALIYIMRCKEFIKTPPHADWNGVSHFMQFGLPVDRPSKTHRTGR